jgi:aryl carrier-like protein
MENLTSIAHYMMPGLILPFNSFPTLPSGKSNRKELVKVVESMKKGDIAAYMPLAAASTEFVPVSTKEEEIMQEAWSAVLGEPMTSIGATSVFSSLGGDSIAAINVVAECRRLSYSVSVSQLLANPTLAKQAACLKGLERKTEKAEVEYTIPPSVMLAVEKAGLSNDDIEDIYPCGPGQIEFLNQGKTENQFWNLTASRPLPQDFDLGRWKEVTRDLTAVNHILRAMYYQADPEDDSSWYQVGVIFNVSLDRG